MRNLFTLRRPFTLAAVSLLALAGIGATANAATDTVYKYSTPKKGYFNISPMAMNPDSDGADYYVNWGGALRLESGDACFNTGVNLPDGATITAVTVFFSGTDGSEIFSQLSRMEIPGDNTNVLAQKNVHDSSGVKKAVNLTLGDTAFLKVDNKTFNYGYGVCLQGKYSYFNGARITYTYDNAGD